MTQFKELKTTTKLSETQYYSVGKIQGDRVQLINDFGENIVVDKAYVEKCLTSADQITEERTVTKTEAAQIFMQNTNVVLTVNYNKQVKPADVEKELMTAYEDSTPKTFAAAVKAAVKRGLNGEERTLVGRHNGSVDEFGRVHIIDMEQVKDEAKDYDTRQRLMDPRTLNWMIIKGIKYKVK